MINHMHLALHRCIFYMLHWLHRQGSPRKRKGPISGTRGMDRFRSEESFYTNPKPECLCQRETPNVNTSHIIRQIRLCITIFLQNDSYADAVVAHCVPYNLLEQYKLVVLLPLYAQGSGMYIPSIKKAGGRYCKIQMKRTIAFGCTAGTDHQRQGLPSTIFLLGVRQVIKKKESCIENSLGYHTLFLLCQE